MEPVENVASSRGIDVGLVGGVAADDPARAGAGIAVFSSQANAPSAVPFRRRALLRHVAALEQVVEPTQGRFTHHLELHGPDELDEEVRQWLRQAWKAAG